MKTIGVIGLGSIGLRHARNLLALGHKVYGWDPDISRAKMLEEVGGGMMDDPLPYCFETIGACDGVVIASPSHMHLAHLERAVTRKKPVLVEKPLADCTDTSYAKSILDDAKAPIMVGNNLRFKGTVVRAKQWLTDGMLKNPTTAIFRIQQFNDKPAYLRDGVILNWGAHEVDLALHLLGPAKVTDAVATVVDSHDVEAVIQLKHDSGCETTIILDYLAKPEVRTFVIGNDKITIKADLVENVAEYRSLDKTTVYKPADTFDENYVDEMREFIKLIDNPDMTGRIGATGEDGLRTLEICLEAKRMAGL